MPLLCTAGTVVIPTPPTVFMAPKRTIIESFGLPPLALSLPAKKRGISLPVTILAFLASAIFTVLVLGVATTDVSGFAHVPALTALA